MAELATTQRALARTQDAVEQYHLLVVFQLAGQEFGLMADVVREIIRTRATTRVPNSAPCINGVINLRGRIIPVFDLRRRLKLPAAAADDANANQAVMIVESEGNDAGLLVDMVSDVIKIAHSAIDTSAHKVEAARKTHFIEGTVKLTGRLVTLLRLEPLLED